MTLIVGTIKVMTIQSHDNSIVGTIKVMTIQSHDNLIVGTIKVMTIQCLVPIPFWVIERGIPTVGKLMGQISPRMSGAFRPCDLPYVI